jgi:hypothetical protein
MYPTQFEDPSPPRVRVSQEACLFRPENDLGGVMQGRT